MSERHRVRAASIGIRSTLVGVLANFLLAAVKAIAGVLGNSYALVADAIESASDVVSSLIVLGGIKIASLPADGDHPYGHGKAEPLAAMLVATALLTAAVAIAIQSVREIITPHHAPAPFTLAVLVLVVLTKETLFRFVNRQGTKIGSTAVRTDAWHHRSDAITSAAAFVGISVALIGGKGYESADDYAAVFAAVIIAFNAMRLLKPAVQEVMDAAPPPEVEKDVRAVAAAVPGVHALDKCYVRKMGLEFYVDLHVIVEGSKSVLEGHEIGHNVKDAIMRANPGVADVLVHIEPTEVLTKFTKPESA
jgi:cation diffusion facilitator family transporter